MKNLPVYQVQELPIYTIGYMPKHKRIQRQCGTYSAAKMLKARGYTLQQAVILLASKGA